MVSARDIVPGEKYMLYQYEPKKILAIIFLVLFGITTCLHIFQLIRKRTWYFVPFVIGGLCYVGRLLNAGQSYGEWTTGPYIMQSLLLLLAPAFFAASIYMILGRIIVLVDGEAHSPIRVRWLTKIFVGGDVLSFLAQSAGGGMLGKAKKQSDVDLGEHIITAGLGIQVLFFGLFVLVAAIFHWRLKAMPSLRSKQLSIPWESYLYILYIASGLILVRSVFRIIEYIMGSDGILLRHEYFLYVFDAALMFVAMVLFNVCHPSRIISKENLDDSHMRGMDSRESGYEMTRESVRVDQK
ncbi:RTA1 like protein-domain-containing protein [Rhexocercosporidium sp. MPI-PUGE-AT-0058]|nr:RTA1 like protein-domain-containing protein [Rhexocercosporidium sp. MPI-PUGE-AT-0058]